MGQRVYTMQFENVAIAAVQDVLSLKAGTANGIEIHYISLSAGGGIVSPADIRLRLKRLPATVTQGSGGTTPTISPVDDGDTKSATATGHANDTSQATTGGTAAVLASWQWNVLLPWEYFPSPEDRDVCQASEGFVLDIPATPPSSTLVSGFMKWRELP